MARSRFDRRKTMGFRNLARRMGPQGKAQEVAMIRKDTPKEPPVDPRKPQPRETPGSHTSGGAKDHRTPRDSEGPE